MQQRMQESTLYPLQHCIRVRGQFCSLGILLCSSDHADVRINNISTGKLEGYLNMDKRCQQKLPKTASSSGKKVMSWGRSYLKNQGGHYNESEVTGKWNIPSWQITPHVWPLNTHLKGLMEERIDHSSVNLSIDSLSLSMSAIYILVSRQPCARLNTKSNLLASKRWRLYGSCRAWR